ncbi:putative integral membrane protein [Cadophora sp. DSE1049]|nr:putative integral membrane protein [Cadophora sp. DSE1049]
MMASDTASKGTEVVVTSFVFLAIATVAVVIRLIARIGYLKNGGRDEIAIVVALLACIALIIATFSQVKHGLGKHFSEVGAQEFSEMLKCLWVAILFYNIALTSVKISIVLQYLRIFIGRTMRVSCWVTLIIVALYGVEVLITAIFTCFPVSVFWTGGEGKCINKKFLWFFNAASNILTDLIILGLPMPVLSTLKLPVKQKVGVIFVFAIGGFVCLVSVLRLHSLYIVSVSTDITWDNTQAAVWSIIEVTVGIICASMPAMKPVISRLFPRLLSSNRSHQPTMLSQGRSYNFRSAFNHTAVRLTEVDLEHQTVTRVEVELDGNTARERDGGRVVEDDGREIFITTSITQDVEKEERDGG